MRGGALSLSCALNSTSIIHCGFLTENSRSVNTRLALYTLTTFNVPFAISSPSYEEFLDEMSKRSLEAEKGKGSEREFPKISRFIFGAKERRSE